MKSAQKKRVDPEDLRQKLKLKHLQVKDEFEKRHKEASDYLKSKNLDLGNLRQHSSKLIAAGAIAGTLALSAPKTSLALLPPDDIIQKVKNTSPSLPALSKATKLRDALKEALPENPRPLDEQEEKHLEKILQETTGIPAKATLEGEHLNTTYGKIGAEQHLRRYPGDTLANQVPQVGDYGSDKPEDILKEGMAPGLGAWGYFAPSKAALTPDLAEKEKWYAVVQTLYLKDWNTRQPYLKDWYKYRKVMIVNTDNGKAVVADIADSGPAAFTGKQYGGSPEVMDYLGGAKYKKGNVLLFFVDDPNNQIPLGPVDYNNI